MRLCLTHNHLNAEFVPQRRSETETQNNKFQRKEKPGYISHEKGLRVLFRPSETRGYRTRCNEYIELNDSNAFGV